MTLKDQIVRLAGGEPIEGVVIGPFGWASEGETDDEAYAAHESQYIAQFLKNKVLTWERAARLLDYEWDQGFGAPQCHAVYAWTPSLVIFIEKYDGSTGVVSIPRNPTDCVPEMIGGG